MNFKPSEVIILFILLLTMRVLPLLLLFISKGMHYGIYLLQNIEWSLYRRHKEFGCCVMRVAPATRLQAGQLRKFGVISGNIEVFVSVGRSIQTLGLV